jgi:predicted metal-dependent enzyme (double-stranded beta helix superfamily)
MTTSVVVDTVRRIKAILDKEGLSDIGTMHISEIMRSLVARSDEIIPFENAEGNENQLGLKPIYIDDSGLILTHGIVVPDQPTPIHSHGTWGVVGVYRGGDCYQVWRRNDQGYGPGPANVQMVDEFVLGPGDAMVIPPPPQDVHVQQGYAGETAQEFVLFGENVLGRLPYLVFDPESGYATEAHSRVPDGKSGSLKARRHR